MHILLIGLVVLCASLALGAFAWLRNPSFGIYPQGERLERLQRSSHYADGEFRNLIDTSVLVDGNSTLSILSSDLFRATDDLRPTRVIPAIKTDLKALNSSQDVVIWLGHSAFFVQLAGKRILIDPVLSLFAAPVSFSTRAFEGSTPYTLDDIPEIDVLLITHDHWDHLDYPTVTALESRVRRAIVPLGVGAHLESWGYALNKLSEADWYEKLEPSDGLFVHLVPARHFSGRGLTRNKTLWSGFVLESASRRLLFSGDTGYGPHFKEIASRFGGFDLAALDMGQYDPRWPTIHMTPEEASQAAEDLRTKALLPAHVGRFNIARHAWFEPFERISAASANRTYRLLTPMIGEPVPFGESFKQFQFWWK